MDLIDTNFNGKTKVIGLFDQLVKLMCQKKSQNFIVDSQIQQSFN
jgi:hypothetical protein